MAIKTLQNNFTTPEQSKRLLELGVPVDSTDCYDYEGSVFRREYNELKDKFWDDDEMVTPCWSVGRLIEIYEICTGYIWQNQKDKRSKIDILIADFGNHKHLFDFSKLEE